MKKIYFSILLVISFFFLTQTVSATTGFGPAEIFCKNKNDTMLLGTASLINAEPEARYGVFTLFNPYINLDTWQIVKNEIQHARVVCLDCGHEMQRCEAIPGYRYGDLLLGNCITTSDGAGCGSENLRFYKPIPRDEFQYLWVEPSGNFHFEKISTNPPTWITTEKISPGGACNIDILYDPSHSFIQENFGAHWEVHLRGSTTTNKNMAGFMVPGIDLRVLLSFKFNLYIEILTPIVKGEPFTIRVTYGDNKGSFGKIPPEGTKITFNGEILYTDSEGKVTFIFPNERGDYEYQITAESSDEYNPVTQTISQQNNNQQNIEGEPFISLSNPLFIIIIICVIAVMVIVPCVKYYYYY